MDKTNKIMVFSSIILIGFIAAVFFHYIMGEYFHMPYPYNNFLFDSSTAFCDFKSLLPYAKDFAPYQTPSLWVVYFPLTYILLFPFSLIKNIAVSYLIFASGFLAFLTYMNTKYFTSENLSKLQNFQNIVIVSVLTYPVLYALDRGNFDMFLFILFAGFIYAFKSEKYMLSAFLLALQNAIKPFPILFLLLFLIKKRYKEFFLSLVMTALFVIGGFAFLKGNFFDQIVVFIKSLMLFKTTYVLQNNNNFGMFYNSSLFMTLKLLLCKLSSPFMISTLLLEKIYRIICLIITALTIFFTCKEKVFWKQVSLLTLYMLLTPYLVVDYKLILLFVPVWLFINAKESSGFDMVYTVLFGLLFIPKNIIITNPAVLQASAQIPDDIKWMFFSLSTIINPLVIMTLMGLIVYEQFLQRANGGRKNG